MQAKIINITPHRIDAYPVENIKGYSRNARTHSDAQIEQIAVAIQRFGFTNAVLIDESDVIIAGHGRLAAAKKLGMESVPVMRIGYLDESEKAALRLSDNKIALNAGWDDDMLRLELESLKLCDFDISLTGFNEGELLGIFCEEPAAGLTDDDDAPDVSADTPVTKLGDIWRMGEHRLMCGDSTSKEAVSRLAEGLNSVDMVLTDPPYGISIVSGSKVGGDGKFGGKVGGGKIVNSNTYAPIIGDDSIETAVSAIQIIKSMNASVEIIWGGNYYASHLENSSCWIVWDKQNTGNFADAELAWTNQKTAVRVFSHMWNGMIKASEHGKSRVHPTQKPVALFEWCIEQYGKKCLTVLDLFGGSGSTLLACEKQEKKCFMMELDPKYCDVIVKRWEDWTGEKAILSDR